MVDQEELVHLGVIVELVAPDMSMDGIYDIDFACILAIDADATAPLQI